MLVLVDGCNVLHVEGVLPADLAGLDVADLVDLLAASRYRREDVVVVMDGPANGPGGRDRIRVVASGAGRSADERIMAFIDASSTPRSILLVSSDREIQRHARRRRCRVLSSEAFLEQLGRDGSAHRHGRRGGSMPRGHTPPLHQDTQRWMAAFGLDEQHLALRPSTPRLRGERPAPRDANAPPLKPSTTPAAALEPAPPPPPPPSPADPSATPSPTRRALDGVRRLDEVDPRELERFDMGEWIGDRPSDRGDGNA